MPDRKIRRSTNRAVREVQMAGAEILCEPTPAALAMGSIDDPVEPFYLNDAELALESSPFRHEYRDDGR
jgi:hypothetical protein